MPWVDNRENEILGIMADLKPLQTNSTITTLDRNPVGKLKSAQMDAVLLFEGPDYADSQPGRNTKGPQKRTLSLVLELWVLDTNIATRSSSLRTLYNEVRKAIQNRRSLFEKNLTRVYTSSVPDVLGIGIVCELKYINIGN